jgi:hypothetical protein
VNVSALQSANQPDPRLHGDPMGEIGTRRSWYPNGERLDLDQLIGDVAPNSRVISVATESFTRRPRASSVVTIEIYMFNGLFFLRVSEDGIKRILTTQSEVHVA